MGQEEVIKPIIAQIDERLGQLKAAHSKARELAQTYSSKVVEIAGAAGELGLLRRQLAEGLEAVAAGSDVPEAGKIVPMSQGKGPEQTE